MATSRRSTRDLAFVGLSIAVSVVLYAIPILKLPFGGNVTLASYLPLFLVALRLGPRTGLLAGLVLSVIRFAINPYWLHPLQALLDYPLPMMSLALAGFFPTRPYLGMTVGALVKFTSHFLSGVLFFAMYAPEGMHPWLYSLVYNGLTVGGDLVIAMLVFALLPWERIWPSAGASERQRA